MAPQYYNLPDDLLEDIFRRLPGKSLVQFKCLNKEWNRRISNFKFNSRTLVLFGTRPSYQLINGDNSVFKVHLPTPWDHKQEGSNSACSSPRIVGSCNGLFLLVFEFNSFVSFFLWNPFTQYYTKFHELDCVKDETGRTAFGFCYDSCADDYKVLVSLIDFSFATRSEYRCILVASLKNKNWVEVDHSFYAGLTIEGPFFQGHLHWGISDEDLDINLDLDECCAPNAIVTFDPVTDKFDKISTPKSNHKGERIAGLSVFDGHLCMVDWDHNEHRIEVMVMKEYGIVESWTSLFVISNFGCRIRKLVPCFKIGDELLVGIVYYKDVNLEVYNLTDNSSRKNKIFDWASIGVAAYEQTLISAPRRYLDANEYEVACEEDDYNEDGYSSIDDDYIIETELVK